MSRLQRFTTPNEQHKHVVVFRKNWRTWTWPSIVSCNRRWKARSKEPTWRRIHSDNCVPGTDLLPWRQSRPPPSDSRWSTLHFTAYRSYVSRHSSWLETESYHRSLSHSHFALLCFGLKLHINLLIEYSCYIHLVKKIWFQHKGITNAMPRSL